MPRSVIANAICGAVNHGGCSSKRGALLAEPTVDTRAQATPLHARVEATAEYTDKPLCTGLETAVAVFSRAAGFDTVSFLDVLPVGAIVRSANTCRGQEAAGNGAHFRIGNGLRRIGKLHAIAKACARAGLTRRGAVWATSASDACEAGKAVATCCAIVALRRSARSDATRCA